MGWDGMGCWCDVMPESRAVVVVAVVDWPRGNAGVGCLGVPSNRAASTAARQAVAGWPRGGWRRCRRKRCKVLKALDGAGREPALPSVGMFGSHLYQCSRHSLNHCRPL